MSSKILGLDQVTAGMTLAQDVLDASGNCLMVSGVVLTKKQLDSLSKRGINSLAIEFEQELSAEEIAALRNTCITQFEHRFRHVQDDVEMQQLKNILMAYRLESLE
ncbi:MAG: hypothetical protein OQK73_04040 [Gammaproteobacteria bacterium]|nr:hypothetical protein [Gammaproteobacteria bacterium]